MNIATIWYGPHECVSCRKLIVKAAREHGAAEFDYPHVVYPSHAWVPHVCRPAGPPGPESRCGSASGDHVPSVSTPSVEDPLLAYVQHLPTCAKGNKCKLCDDTVLWHGGVRARHMFDPVDTCTCGRDPALAAFQQQRARLTALVEQWKREADRGDANARAALAEGLKLVAVMSAGMATALREKADELNAILTAAREEP